MMKFRSWAMTAFAVALLAACGGSDDAYIPGSGQPEGAPTTKGTFTAVVSFGDSLSDVGTYTPATSLTANGQAPYFGGKFTTNTNPTSTSGTVWVENLATTLGLLVTPAQVGFAGQSVSCPAAANPALAGTCTGYGQGGSRVTDPNGIGKTSGALTVPVKTQIANHLQRFTSFKSSDLVMVWAGNNDGFIQFGAFAAAAAQIQADAAAGKISADQANQMLFQAQTAAQTAMKTAALELAEYIKSQILAKGATYVAVMYPVDPAITPFGSSVPASAKPLLTTLNDTFKLWLLEGLTGKPVKLIDLNPFVAQVVAQPGNYGFVNSTVPACDAAKISAITGGQITDGSSLFCNSTAGAPYNGLRTGANANTWLFADGVHPTTGGHKGFSDFIAAQLRSFGWIS